MNDRTMTVTIYKNDHYKILKNIKGYFLDEKCRLLVLQHVNESITVYNLDFISYYEIRLNEVTKNEQAR